MLPYAVNDQAASGAVWPTVSDRGRRGLPAGGYDFGAAMSKMSRGFAASFQLPVGRLQWTDEWPLGRFQRADQGFGASTSKTSSWVLART